jgi:hypothetical protein
MDYCCVPRTRGGDGGDGVGGVVGGAAGAGGAGGGAGSVTDGGGVVVLPATRISGCCALLAACMVSYVRTCTL